MLHSQGDACRSLLRWSAGPSATKWQNMSAWGRACCGISRRTRRPRVRSQPSHAEQETRLQNPHCRGGSSGPSTCKHGRCCCRPTQGGRNFPAVWPRLPSPNATAASDKMFDMRSTFSGNICLSPNTTGRGCCRRFTAAADWALGAGSRPQLGAVAASQLDFRQLGPFSHGGPDCAGPMSGRRSARLPQT